MEQPPTLAAMIYDPRFQTVTVAGVEFGIGFLTMLVVAAQEGQTMTLELQSDGTIVMTRARDYE